MLRRPCSTLLEASIRNAAALGLQARQYSSGPDTPVVQGAQQHTTDLWQLASSNADAGFVAAQSLEPMSQLMNPIVLSSSAWELMHTATGLPWWASIPLTTLALRSALLPLTLKAKSAALNFVLAQRATETASRLLQQMKQEDQQQAAAAGAAQQSLPTSSKQQLKPAMQQLRKPTWFKLSRMYYRYFRQQHKTTSLGWFVANTAVQVNVFIWMSAALRQMCASHWPGLSSEGLSYFTDLSQPTVILSTLQMPYGVAGIGLPFALLFFYLKTVEKTPLAMRSPRWKLLLDCGVLPYFIMSSIVPQATLLYWGANAGFYYGLNWLQQQPKAATWLGLPSALLPLPRSPKEEKERAEMEAAEARQLICGSSDDGFLRYLAANYLSRSRHQQALQCLQRLTVLAPGDVRAFSALGQTAAELQQWPVAAAAYERAAELFGAAAEWQEQQQHLLLAGKNWLNAAAEARQLQKSGSKQPGQGGAQAAAAVGSSSSGSGISSSVAAAGSSSSSSSSAAGSADPTVRAIQLQDYVGSALSALSAAISLRGGPPAPADAWYLLSMAQAAGGQRDEAFATAQCYWDKACASADDDSTAKSNAAAKLLPVLVNLCKQSRAQPEPERLLQLASFAVDVARCGWDRQSQEQLQEVLAQAAQAASERAQYMVADGLLQLKEALEAMVAKQSQFRST